jgi:muramoyltetrapeptide carboxypeptidase LdcA involved in peptidoglycan recycling
VPLVSPSFAAPAVFPEVHDRGVAYLTEHFGVRVREYPTTRELGASPADRARDLMDAFSDNEVGAVMATIGGDDQIRVLAHLDADRMTASPKRFIGYSDNTNLHNFLFFAGVASFHGGSTLVHLARAGGPHPVSMESLRWALFGAGERTIEPQPTFSDVSPEWNDLATLDAETPRTEDPGWTWSGSTRSVTGPSWGGNMEVLVWQLGAQRWMLENSAYDGCVLILETSEEMPSATEVTRALRVMGERGLLQQFPAIVVAKPKAWNHSRRLSAPDREQFRNDQRDAVLDSIDQYNPDAVLVIGPDFGHTDPQFVLPYGGSLTIDGDARLMLATY